MKRFGVALYHLVCAWLSLSLVVGCQADRPLPSPPDSDQQLEEFTDANACQRPAEGCACETEGEQSECGSVHERRGEYVICSKGTRLCTDGIWGACQADQLNSEVLSVRAAMQGGLRFTALGSAVSCDNLCDPECKLLGDVPNGLDVPSDLMVTPAGLTLPSSGSGGSCNDIAISPTNPVVTITDIRANGSVTASPTVLSFAGTCSGGLSVQPNWTLDSYDRAVIEANGSLRVFSGIAGNIQVTGSTSTDSDTTSVSVQVAIGSLASVGSQVDPGKTLYPYRNTVFPLDLPAPLVQWDGGGITPNQVQVALRYPAGSTSPTFLYTKTYSSEPREGTLNTSVPAWQVPQHIWSAFDRSVSGDPVGGEILIRRRTSSKTYAQLSIPVRFATAAVRGTAYYTQYQRTLSSSTCSSQSCNYSGSSYTPGQTCPVGIVTHGSGTLTSQIRAIDLSSPSATNTDPLGGVGGCPVCHSVSADGGTFVSGNQAWQNPITGGIDRITLAGGTPNFVPQQVAPTYSGLSDYGTSATGGDPYNNQERSGENSRGFSYAAISPDGSLVMQGPTFWGSTEDTPSSNNVQDATLVGLAGRPKSYFFVDTDVPGVGVQFATTASLPSYSWASGRFSGSSGYLTVDGVTLTTVGQAVLVKDESSRSRNGVYSLTRASPWQLTRRYDADSSSELTNGMQVRVSDGSTLANRVYQLSASGSIAVNSTNLDFGEVITPAPVFGSARSVKVATDNILGPGTVSFSSGVLNAGSNGALVVDGVTLGIGDAVLVKNQSNQASNGIYQVVLPGNSLTKWRLQRRSDSDGAGELTPGLEVTVSQGSTNGGRAFYISSPISGSINVNTTSISFADSTIPSMMVPQFSPDGTKVVYVNADADIAGGQPATGWRRGLSIIDFNPTTFAVSNKRRLINTWNASSAGVPFKWPFFEPDSRSIIYVESETGEFCSASDSSHSASVNSDIRRACFEASYGSMSPTTRGYWKGRIYSIDSSNPSSTRVELSKLNDADDDGGADDSTDGDRSYQPTVLPFSSGGYRWVIFASPRAYGNQFNAKSSSGTPTHFSCAANMLWMSALTDTVAAGTDRSNPAFLLPGQNISKITSSNHYVNERGYLVPSLCKDEGASCTTDDECCGATASPPTKACRAPAGWTPAAGPPAKTCEVLDGTCHNAGGSCSTSADCCNSAACVDFACAPPPSFEEATFVREYVAECPVGYFPDWQLFNYHLTTDSDSKIEFSVQTAGDLDDLDTADVVVLGESTDTLVSPAAPGFWDVGATLEDSRVSRHFTYLRVLVKLVPSSDGQVAPVIHDWEQRYTCAAGE